MRQNLVFRHRCRCRILHDHQPVVKPLFACRINDQEGRQPTIEPPVQQQKRPPLGHIRHICNHQLEKVQCITQRRAVKIAAGNGLDAARQVHRPVFRQEDQRIVRHSVDLARQHARHVTQRVQRRAQHHRCHPQRVRVLGRPLLR